jgi:hypothetical protein
MAEVARFSVTADGNTTGIALAHRAPLVAFAYGSSFGSGTIALEFSFDNSTWVAVKDYGGTAVSFTANGMSKKIELPQGVRVRTATTGSTNPSVTVSITEVVT